MIYVYQQGDHMLITTYSEFKDLETIYWQGVKYVIVGKIMQDKKSGIITYKIKALKE